MILPPVMTKGHKTNNKYSGSNLRSPNNRIRIPNQRQNIPMTRAPRAKGETRCMIRLDSQSRPKPMVAKDDMASEPAGFWYPRGMSRGVWLGS